MSMRSFVTQKFPMHRSTWPMATAWTQAEKEEPESKAARTASRLSWVTTTGVMVKPWSRASLSTKSTTLPFFTPFSV